VFIHPWRGTAMAPRSRSRQRSASSHRRDRSKGSRQRSVATAARANLRPRRSRSCERREDERRRRLGRSRSYERRDGERIGNWDAWVAQNDRVESAPPRRRSRSRDDGHHYGKSKGKGKTPLPRPGFDDDDRLQQLGDDPRYFKGAELGKAQKAAMGITGLTGRNTASFEPKSTLVRPAMRVYYGSVAKRYRQPFKHDDVIIVPDFFCEEKSFESYHEILKDLKMLSAEEEFDLASSHACSRAVARMRKYFSIEDEGSSVRFEWYRNGSDDSPLQREVGRFKSRLSKGRNCMVILALGATRELAFRRTVTDELLFFPQINGGLSFFGRDVCLRWQQGINICQQADCAGQGHILVSVVGNSTAVLEESNLAPAPSDEKRGPEGFDGRWDVPCRQIPRPLGRIITVPPRRRYSMPVKHDDIIVVPEFACAEADWEIYYKLISEMRMSQGRGDNKAEWISWHEGAHLLSQNPEGSATYKQVLAKMCDYFSIGEKNRGTRFNWYRDGADWKPFHHDSAAFNPSRAKNQNCTIGISFGASRELAFRHAKTGELLYFPQKNGMLFYFGRDANIVWQHGINALPDADQDGKGRISIILWGLCTTAIDEAGSPPMLDNESRGEKGKGKGKGKGGYDGRRNQPCRDFQKGSCRYGEHCRFSHEQQGGAAAGRR